MIKYHGFTARQAIGWLRNVRVGYLAHRVQGTPSRHCPMTHVPHPAAAAAAGSVCSRLRVPERSHDGVYHGHVPRRPPRLAAWGLVVDKP